MANIETTELIEALRAEADRIADPAAPMDSERMMSLLRRARAAACHRDDLPFVERISTVARAVATLSNQGPK